MIDLLIQNGRVIDPVSGRDGTGSVAVHNGKIVSAEGLTPADAVETVDASGCFVTPGFIDFHAHIFTDGCERGVYPEPAYFPFGVTTAVDGGSAGVANYASFFNSVITPSKVRILSYLNICSLGLGTYSYQENINPATVNQEKIGFFLEKYRDNIRALKVRQTRNISGEYGLEPLRLTRKLADEFGVPVVVHVTDSPGEVRETLDLLRAGDIFCHVYHGKGKTILGQDGKVLPEVRAARERGVLFDAAHGGNQFSNQVARAAMDQGFLPDFISSDISLKTMYRAPLYSMGKVMSKYLNMGMPPETLFAIVIRNAAQWLRGGDGFGSLKVGACADIAVTRIIEKETDFEDSHGNFLSGSKLLKTEMTVREGIPVFRQIDF